MSSDKSATERLRALLDERGVKHVGLGGMTRWTNENGCVCRAYSRPGHLTVDVAIMDASPEQAIDATLGTRTLTAEQVMAIVGRHQPDYCSDTHVCFDWQAIADELNATQGRGTCHDAAGKQMAFFACSACGSTDEHKHPRFCHGCGREAVDA